MLSFFFLSLFVLLVLLIKLIHENKKYRIYKKISYQVYFKENNSQQNFTYKWINKMYDYERDGREQRVYTSMKRERERGGERGKRSNSHKWARLESDNREEYEMSLCSTGRKFTDKTSHKKRPNKKKHKTFSLFREEKFINKGFILKKKRTRVH